MRRLHAGTPCLTLGIRNARSPDIVRMAARVGYASVWIDLEHSTLSVEQAVAMAVTAEDLGLGAWVRIPEGDLGMIGRLLDGGVDGIIVPQVDTPGAAADAAGRCRYPPRGLRSQNARLGQFGFADLPADQRMRQADARVVLQVLIESPEGVINCSQIAAVDGVDLVGIGLNDLSASLGCPGEIDHPAVQAACATILARSRAAGASVVVGGVRTRAQFDAFREMGALPLVFAGIDTDILFTALQARTDAWLRS